MARKIKQKQKIISTWLQQYAQERDCADWKYCFIADRQTHHYQVVTMGWDKNVFRYYVLFHLHIANDGKVWFYANNTEVEIDEELCALGIPFSEMVVAFHKPSLREYTKYALG